MSAEGSQAEVKATPEAAVPASAELAAAPAADAAAPPSAAAPAPSADSDDRVEEADSTAEYKPVVTLKPVEITTGEEQEQVLYKQRSACYRFDADSSSWKERGRGDVKLLQHKETQIIRVLLRQEKTLKLCMNHKVDPVLELVPNAGSDRSWTWRTLDYSTEDGDKVTFALRFKDAETAAAFKVKWDECREQNKARAAATAAAAGTANTAAPTTQPTEPAADVAQA